MKDWRSWALTIGSGAIVGIALVACNPDDNDTAIVQRDSNGTKTGLVIFTDTMTGCQYVRTFGRDGITPRLGRDGKQICG